MEHQVRALNHTGFCSISSFSLYSSFLSALPPKFSQTYVLDHTNFFQMLYYLVFCFGPLVYIGSSYTQYTLTALSA